MAAHTPLTKTVLTRNFPTSTRLHLTNQTNLTFNDSQTTNNFQNASIHEESEIHGQISDRDRSVLPRSFSTPFKNKVVHSPMTKNFAKSPTSMSALNVSGNTTGIVDGLIGDLDDSVGIYRLF